MRILSVLSTCVFISSIAVADQVLVFSGGDSPTGNHYSQYLQTKTLYTYLAKVNPVEQVTVFFGAGNQINMSPLMADVHKVDRSTGAQREVMIVGGIQNNNTATKKNVLNYLASSQVANLKPTENFFIFISDHGMPNVTAQGERETSFSNNCINTWGYTVNLDEQSFAMMSFPERCLAKNELKASLEKLNAKNIVFSMSQCFSGGFHQMSVTQVNNYPTANPKICGFTAITKDTTASGCTADVDGPGYQGYERFFTEQLSGVDVVTGQRLRSAKSSIQEAHRAATVQDFTKDIPISTSDSFLMDWFSALARPSFKPRSSAVPVTELQKVMVQNSVPGVLYDSDLAYKSKTDFFDQVVKELGRVHVDLRDVFFGPLAQVEKALQATRLELKAVNDAAGDVGQEIYQNESVISMEWSRAVLTGKTDLSEFLKMIESQVFYQNDSTQGYGLGDELTLYFLSIKTVTDPMQAEQLSQYKAERMKKANAWALASKDPRLVSLVTQNQKLQVKADQFSESADRLTKREGHIRRVLIYRQVLGAWNALKAMSDTQALNELHALLQCESTALAGIGL